MPLVFTLAEAVLLDYVMGYELCEPLAFLHFNRIKILKQCYLYREIIDIL